MTLATGFLHLVDPEPYDGILLTPSKECCRDKKCRHFRMGYAPGLRPCR